MSEPGAVPDSQLVESVESLWGVPRQPAWCAHCRQAFLVEAARLGKPCPHCARGKLAAQPAMLRPEPPELLISFRVTRSDLRATLSDFVKDVWLHNDDFNVQTLLRRTVPVFWPMWLVDCDVVGDWEAEVGFDYQVKSSQESYRSGAWQSHEVVETRMRWEPRAGQLGRHYENYIVPALNDHPDLIKLVGDYPLDQAIPYSPAQLGGGTALRVPDLQPKNAWSLAQAKLDHAAGDECCRAAGALRLRNLSIHAQYESLHWTLLLLPMYVTFYRDDAGEPHLVHVNGRTGQVSGTRLASQRKGRQWAGGMAAFAAVVFVLGLVCFALHEILPPLRWAGIAMDVLAYGIALLALVPLAWPWQWNRNQQAHKITSV